MKYFKNLILFLLVILLSSCSSLKITDSNIVGNWNILFTGELSGNAKINIKNDGSFTSEEFQLTNNNNNSVSNYKLRGVVNASIIQSGRFTQGTTSVGELNGNFAANTGAGTYSVTGGLEGAWTASKE